MGCSVSNWVARVSSLWMGGRDSSAEVVEELGSQGSPCLVKPTFVKNSMMAGFHKARCVVDIANIGIGCRVPNKNASKGVAVQFCTAGASAFDAHTRAEHAEAT